MTRYTSWRDKARPIIARVLQETTGRPEESIRKALHDAYPFGPRAHHPYKTWLDEIGRQRGARNPLNGRRRVDAAAVETIGDGDLFAAPASIACPDCGATMHGIRFGGEECSRCGAALPCTPATGGG